MTDPSGLVALLPKLRGAPVLCVGDVILDRFVYGEVERISPEAPVPVLRVERQSAMLGGAGNVARNLAALGAKVGFVAVVGADETGRELAALCDALSGVDADLIADPGRPTSIKTRFVTGGQQLLRTDQERADSADGKIEKQIVKAALDALKACAAVILSDYGKGALTDKVIAEIVAAAGKAKTPVLVDPKGADYGRYRGADLVTPNRKELANASRLPTGSNKEVALAAFQIVEECGIKAVLATQGAEGMTLVNADREGTHYFQAQAREVFDVSGAGDTVISMIAAAFAAGIGLEDAASLANAAAGVVVSKTGTAVAYPDEIAAALHRQELGVGEAKLLSLEQLKERAAAWRGQGRRIGFTNGCFDLLHPGHVSLLDQARAACDRLVVGLNTDASVRRLKGKDRPIQSEAARAAVLGSLAAIDAVVLFAEETPLDLIEALRPDVLVKGADYTVDQVVGADLVRSWGGEVVLAELTPGQSTTGTIAKMAR